MGEDNIVRYLLMSCHRLHLFSPRWEALQPTIQKISNGYYMGGNVIVTIP